MVDQIAEWFGARIPTDWFIAPPEIQSDQDEVLIVGRLAEVEGEEEAGLEARIAAFREATRERRVQIAEEGERFHRRKVSWGVRVGADGRHLFTTLSLPVMTRLRLTERAVLDTLVAAGVARSRSEALGWCVRLVGEHQSDWLKQLQEALSAVNMARAKGPR